MTKSGAVAGALLAFTFALAANLGPFFGFATFVLLGLWSSRFGAGKKKSLGVFQNEKGPRSWIHAVANCGFGAMFVLVGYFSPDLLHPELAALMAGGSLAAVCADTMASEWGTYLGGKPRDVLTWQQVKIGTDGAVTWPGTLCGLIGAALIALAMVDLAGGYQHNFLLLIIAGVIGNLADSVFGATIQPYLGKHGGSFVNAMCALVGGTIAGLL